MSTTEKSYLESIKMRDKQSMNDCWFIRQKLKDVKICYSDAGEDEEYEIYYRVKSIPLDLAKAYLQWIKDTVFDDFEFNDYSIICRRCKYKTNTLFVFSLFRVLWEGGMNRYTAIKNSDIEEKLNLAIITEVAEGKIKTLPEYLRRYKDLMEACEHDPHPAHSIIDSSFSGQPSNKELAQMEFSKEKFKDTCIQSVQKIYKTFQPE